MARKRSPVRPLTHISKSGEAEMVDVGGKAVTPRRAVASARVRLERTTIDRIAKGDLAKGDVFSVARIAGIQAAKQTQHLIPLCHGLALTKVDVSFRSDRKGGHVTVRATAQAVDRTGVEMEAMTAAAVSALTIYDMVKAIDRWAVIEAILLEEKSGGKSGHLTRGDAR